MAALVHDPGGLRVGVVAGDDPLEPGAEQVVVPVAEGQKLLERAGRHVRQAGHRLHALAWQVAELAPDVIFQVQACLGNLEAVGEFVQVVRKRRAQRADLLSGHP